MTPEINHDIFMERVAASKFSEHSQYFRSIAKPAVEILFSNASVSVGGSRFGGVPDLHENSDWPHHKLEESNQETLNNLIAEEEEDEEEWSEGDYTIESKGYGKILDKSKFPYRFLAQFNFSDVPSLGPGYPSEGLLTLFVKWDSEGEMEFFWRDEDFVHATFRTNHEKLSRATTPKPMDCAPESSMTFRRTLDIPYNQFQRSDWPFDFDERSDDYRDLRDSLHGSNYLFGYPSHRTLYYDPTPGPEWTSLLTLDSVDDWCWHDGDKLMVFIKHEDLAKSDFSSLKSDAG